MDCEDGCDAELQEAKADLRAVVSTLKTVTREKEQMESALRDLLDTGVVMSSTRDDVTICVTKLAYNKAYTVLIAARKALTK